VQVAKNVSQYLPEPGESREGVHDIFSTVQGRVIGMMGGGAAEMAILGDIGAITGRRNHVVGFDSMLVANRRSVRLF
jgi:hypothetical protein